MLYNPQWKRETLADLIAWLETKDPDESYNFWDCKSCLMAQWMGDLNVNSWPAWAWRIYKGLDASRIAVGSGPENTFGQALARARACL